MKGRRFAVPLIAAGAALAAVVVAVGCSAPAYLGMAPAARRPNMIPAAQLQDNPRLAEGQRAFMQYCNQCHVGGAAGLGPSLNDKRLPPWLIRFQVRHGLGAMPSFPKRVMSDRQLDDVVTYVRFLRFHPNGPTQG
ncbi:MAG TPA: cytochrome c [Tepidisphaeraceae bacterium]|jgi:mono/diheme cytochrome c family protein